MSETSSPFWVSCETKLSDGRGFLRCSPSCGSTLSHALSARAAAATKIHLSLIAQPQHSKTFERGLRHSVAQLSLRAALIAGEAWFSSDKMSCFLVFLFSPFLRCSFFIFQIPECVVDLPGKNTTHCVYPSVRYLGRLA
jgi:hypothetical protein